MVQWNRDSACWMACDRNRSDLDQGEALAALGCSGRTLRKARATENVPESCRIGSTYEAIIALPLTIPGPDFKLLFDETEHCLR